MTILNGLTKIRISMEMRGGKSKHFEEDLIKLAKLQHEKLNR
jgi:hypothetical protein